MDIGKEIISELVERNSSCKVYVDDIPEIYKRYTNNVTDRILSIDSAAFEKVCIIANTKRDIFHLTKAGCYFGKISEDEAIYTNDETAICILEEKGIPITPYYNIKSNVDLDNLAKLNNLQTDNNDLIVEGSDHSLVHGPYNTIYEGRLQVSYQIKLISSSVNNELFKVCLSHSYGNTIVAEKSILKSDLDENGCCTVTIEGDLPNCAGVEYLLFANGDTKIRIENIIYGKIN